MTCFDGIQQQQLSPCEREAWNRVRCKLAVEAKTTFTADDLHTWELDKTLYGADSQKVGMFTEKLLRLRLVTAKNQVLGRYNRFIWVYEVLK